MNTDHEHCIKSRHSVVDRAPFIPLPALTASCMSNWANYLQLAADSDCSSDMLPRIYFKYEFSRRPISYLLHLSVIDTSHLNTPDVFHQDPCIIPWERSHCKTWFCPFYLDPHQNWGYWGLFWAKINLSSKFCENLISIFFVIMLTNQRIPVKTWQR